MFSICSQVLTQQFLIHLQFHPGAEVAVVSQTSTLWLISPELMTTLLHCAIHGEKGAGQELTSTYAGT